jgi:hypothetical protein
MVTRWMRPVCRLSSDGSHLLVSTTLGVIDGEPPSARVVLRPEGAGAAHECPATFDAGVLRAPLPRLAAGRWAVSVAVETSSSRSPVPVGVTLVAAPDHSVRLETPEQRSVTPAPAPRPSLRRRVAAGPAGPVLRRVRKVVRRGVRRMRARGTMRPRL